MRFGGLISFFVISFVRGGSNTLVRLDVKNRVPPCARMYLCPPPIKSHEDLSQTIETNKTTTTPRNINSNNLMH